MKREALIAVRKAKGLSQSGLARAIGVTRATVNKYESGRASPREATWKKIATVLGTPVEILWAFSEERRGPKRTKAATPPATRKKELH